MAHLYKLSFMFVIPFTLGHLLVARPQFSNLLNILLTFANDGSFIFSLHSIAKSKQFYIGFSLCKQAGLSFIPHWGHQTRSSIALSNRSSLLQFKPHCALSNGFLDKTQKDVYVQLILFLSIVFFRALRF